MKSFNLILVSLLILAGITTAQSPLGLNVIYRNDGIITVAASTNPPTLVTTNLSIPTPIIGITTNYGDMYHPGIIIGTNSVMRPAMIRVSLVVQNTNASVVAVYSDVNGSNLVSILNANDKFTIYWPIADSTQYYVRSGGTNSVSVIRSETWGR